MTMRKTAWLGKGGWAGGALWGRGGRWRGPGGVPTFCRSQKLQDDLRTQRGGLDWKLKDWKQLQRVLPVRCLCHTQKSNKMGRSSLKAQFKLLQAFWLKIVSCSKMPVGSGPCPRQGRLSTTVYNWVFGTRCIDRIVLAPLSASPPTPGAARMQGSERIAMDCFILLPTFFSRKLDQVGKRDQPWWSWLLINMVEDLFPLGSDLFLLRVSPWSKIQEDQIQSWENIDFRIQNQQEKKWFNLAN